jgi:hypothetical protein
VALDFFTQRLPQAFLLAVSLLLFAIVVDASDGSRVSISTVQEITAHSVCKEVTNNSATAKDVYIPTVSSAEWASFYNNPPAGINVADCSCPITSGSQTYSTPGTYNFTIPCHNTLTVEVWGAGGGGSGQVQTTMVHVYGTVGGASTWDEGVLIANGGGRSGNAGNEGIGGTASGGTTNIAGQDGSHGSGCFISGKGGDGANGGAGGASTAAREPGNPGFPPGGGGSGGASTMKGCGSGTAGAGGGGYTTRIYSGGIYTPDDIITVGVGSGGVGGNATVDGGGGADGQVIITWE